MNTAPIVSIRHILKSPEGREIDAYPVTRLYRRRAKATA